MRYTSPKSVQLVINSAKLKLTLYSALQHSAFSSAPRGASKYLHTVVRKVNLELRSNSSCRISLPRQAVRHCSYQRRMCYAQGDAVGGSIDITKGREVLPTNVKPVHYDLTLEPDLEKFTFEGTVIIEYVIPRGVLQVRRDITVVLCCTTFVS